MRIRAVVPVVLLLALSACARPATSAPSADMGSPRASASPAPDSPTTSFAALPLIPTAQAICRTALPGRTVVSASGTSVGQLRAYQYGGPVAHRPLAGSFPEAPGSGKAEWCWTRDTLETLSAWGVRSGEPPIRAMTITGPSTGIPAGAPIVP
jgi:hypothetical protein